VAINLPNIEGKVKIDDSDLDKVARKLHELSRANADFSKSSDGASKANKKHSDSLFEVVKAGALMAGTMKLIKFPAMVSGANLAAQGLNALAAGAVAFASAIAPAAATVAALPGLMAAAAQGMGVTKLATIGLKDELKALQKAAGEPFVPQATKDFAKFLFDMKPLLNDLQERAARGLFPGVEAGLTSLKNLFPVVQSAVSDTAAELGRLAERAGALLGSGVFARDFGILAKANVEIIRNMGEGALFLTDALRQVMVAASPMTIELSRMAKAGAEFVASAVGAEGATERMTKFFERSVDVLKQLGRILGNTGEGLFRIFSQGADLGADLLGSLEKITAKFAEWTASVSGQNAIQRFFEEARAPLHEVALLIRDVGLAFFELNSGIDLAEVISQIRTQLLPSLIELLNTTGKLFTQELINLAAKFVETLAKFGTETGALTSFVRALGVMLDVVNGLANIPGFVEFVATMAILRGTMAAFQFAGFITGFSSLSTIIPKVGAALTSLFWIINAHPIGVLITAIAALAAGLVYAYNHSEKFRDIVDKAFLGLKVAVATAVEAVVGLLQGLVNTWLDVAGAFVHGAAIAFGWAGEVGEKLKVADAAFEQFRAGVNGKFEDIKGAAEDWKNKTIADAQATSSGVQGHWMGMTSSLQSHWGSMSSKVQSDSQAMASKLIADAAGIGRAVDALPRVKSIDIHAVDNASATIRSIEAALGAIKSKSVTVTAIHRDTGNIANRHQGGPILHGGGPVEKMHFGGIKRDERLALLQIDEFVFKRPSARSIGRPALEEMNATGKLPASTGAPAGTTVNIGTLVLKTIYDPNSPISKQRAAQEISDMLIHLETQKS
jgi:hypothetical protein